mgnify:CR=1 FL=1
MLGTFWVSLAYFLFDDCDGGEGVLEVGEGDDGAVGGEEGALETHEGLVAQDISETLFWHADSSASESGTPDLLGYVQFLSLRLVLFLASARGTVKRFFYRRARSRMRSTIWSVSSWKKEQPR